MPPRAGSSSSGDPPVHKSICLVAGWVMAFSPAPCWHAVHPRSLLTRREPSRCAFATRTPHQSPPRRMHLRELIGPFVRERGAPRRSLGRTARTPVRGSPDTHPIPRHDYFPIRDRFLFRRPRGVAERDRAVAGLGAPAGGPIPAIAFLKTCVTNEASMGSWRTHMR